MTPTRGAVGELLEPEESWPERTMLRESSAKECLATESAQTRSTNPGAEHNNPRLTNETSTTRARFTITRTHDQHEHLDTTPLLQECRSLLEDGFASERSAIQLSANGHTERVRGRQVVLSRGWLLLHQEIVRTVPGAIVSLPRTLPPKQKNTSSVMPTVIDAVVLAVTDSVWWNSI
jgi:hypothetical protein